MTRKEAASLEEMQARVVRLLRERAPHLFQLLLDQYTPEERLRGVPPEELLRVLPPEERLRGLTPEERLRGLTPEELERLRRLLH